MALAAPRERCNDAQDGRLTAAPSVRLHDLWRLHGRCVRGRRRAACAAQAHEQTQAQEAEKGEPKVKTLWGVCVHSHVEQPIKAGTLAMRARRLLWGGCRPQLARSVSYFNSTIQVLRTSIRGFEELEDPLTRRRAPESAAVPPPVWRPRVPRNFTSKRWQHAMQARCPA